MKMIDDHSYCRVTHMMYFLGNWI